MYNVVVAELSFRWDPAKDTINRRKHGIGFAEAATVFYDDDALLVADPEHSQEEDRFLLLGLSSRLRALVVCHCYREAHDVIRIISARRADRSEREQYNKRRRS
jgi:uncharacterized protein